MMFTELCRKEGITDLREIEKAYGSLMQRERDELKGVSMNLAKSFKDFGALIENFEADLEKHYNLDKRRSEGNKLSAKF